MAEATPAQSAPDTPETAPIDLAIENGDALVPEAGLWLDPRRPRDFAFVSHAHADHFAPHRRILCSAPTRRILEARFSPEETEFLDLDIGERHVLDEAWRVELLPAGHIAGSAMLWLERVGDGATLLHTGDFKTREGVGAERNRPKAADTLVMETTFGIPKFRLPPAGDVLAAMVKFAREAVEEGEIPVFLGYSLGKAQEILIALHERAPELRFQAHASVRKMNEVVAALGWQLPAVEPFDPAESSPEGAVVVVPPAAGRSRAVRRLGDRARVAMVSGWGMDAGAKYRYQCDEVFPLSDHAGYDDLLAFVEAVGPRRVFTIHGYREAFARDLRGRGVEAWPLQPETQLELGLEAAGATTMDGSTGLTDGPNPVDPAHSGVAGGCFPESERPESERPESEFAAFTAVCERIASVTGKQKKRDLLADYLASLPDDGALASVATFLSGKALPRSAGLRAARVGSAVIRAALLGVTGLPLAQYRRVSSSQADASRTAHLVLRGKTEPRPHRIAEVAALFERLAGASGQTERIALLREALTAFHHSEGALVVGILTGDLRIGLKEGLLEEAIAAAFDRRAADVREAHMLTGDIGRTAELARQDRLDEAEATWFTPLKVMLASPEETAEAIVGRLGGAGDEESPGIWLEHKFDGIRAQLHKRGDRVEIYSRDLRPLHDEFAELIGPAREIDRDVILDGEIIAFAEGKRLTFFDLQKRLGRRDQGDLFLGEAVPVKFVAFDLLGVDGEGWLERPLVERRAALDALCLPPAIARCEVLRAASAEAIDEAFNEARRLDNEGLVAKDPGAPYSPGRRGKQWLKLKKAMPTLDAVVVAAQQGHGKRSHVLSDYTFAVRDEATGELRVIGKAYSGLTDEEIEELSEHFREKTVERTRSTRLVEPDTVLEIAFDAINPSKRHDSGLALRFPRIVAIRRDKTPADIDTLAYARKLAGLGNRT